MLETEIVINTSLKTYGPVLNELGRSPESCRAEVLHGYILPPVRTFLAHRPIQPSHPPIPVQDEAWIRPFICCPGSQRKGTRSCRTDRSSVPSPSAPQGSSWWSKTPDLLHSFETHSVDALTVQLKNTRGMERKLLCQTPC